MPADYSIHNSDLAPFIQPSYTPDTLTALWQYLDDHHVFDFSTVGPGLFPAAAAADAGNTGYKYVWVRDNIYVAYAHLCLGKVDIAAQTLSGLMQYFQTNRDRFTAIIQNPARKENVMQRPHIRFDGETLSELDEDWEHAQNDALGYFLWLYCKLVSANAISLKPADTEMLQHFVEYLAAIRYWEDPDSGHWEEGRKVSASSIGAAVAGLKGVRSLYTAIHISSPLLKDLITKGEIALNNILPSESHSKNNSRRYDAALLFLIYPLNVVTFSQAQSILSDVATELTGPHGIQRYPHDSFWCRDFQDLDKSIQTAKYTGREAWLEQHNRAVQRGEEAQWCIFDPIISAAYGQWFQSTGDKDFLALQTCHLNRSLGQITGSGNTVTAGEGSNIPVHIPAHRCPELYYIQHGEYTPNVSTPLLWTQANLLIALKTMEHSLNL